MRKLLFFCLMLSAGGRLFTQQSHFEISPFRQIQSPVGTNNPNRNLSLMMDQRTAEGVRLTFRFYGEPAEGDFFDRVLLESGSLWLSLSEVSGRSDSVEIAIPAPFSDNTPSGSGIQVNPDGTHSMIFNNGNISTVVNPDGTHSVMFNNGNTATQINPDGTHSVVINNGDISTVVNPDGTHSVIFNNGNTATQINPDGTQTFTHFTEFGSTTLHPDGSVTTVQGQDTSLPGFHRLQEAIQSAGTPDQIRGTQFTISAQLTPEQLDQVLQSGKRMTFILLFSNAALRIPLSAGETSRMKRKL